KPASLIHTAPDERCSPVSRILRICRENSTTFRREDFETVCFNYHFRVNAVSCSNELGGRRSDPVPGGCGIISRHSFHLATDTESWIGRCDGADPGSFQT